MSGLRKFLLRGNLIDLAVAVVIGTAFTAIVTALAKDLITPLIAAVGGKPNFGNLAFTVNHSRFAYGDFINALVTFVIHRGGCVLPDRAAGRQAAGHAVA